MSDFNSNNHDAFLRLYAAHEPAVRGFVRSLLPTRDDASEVMQEVAIVLWRKFDELDAPSNFRKWAFGVAKFEVLSWRRDKARDRHVFSDDFLETLAEETADRDDRAERQRVALDMCLRKLPDEKRRLIRRAYDGETRIASMASELNRSAMSVYKMLHRLRIKLVKCTQEFLEKEGVAS